MERLWLREVRRAAWRASAPFGSAGRFGLRRGRGRNDGRLPSGLCSLMAPKKKAVWAAVWAVAGYVAIWTGLFVGHLWSRDLAEFGTTTGVRDTMTPIRAVLFSWSWLANQTPIRILGLTWSYM